MAQAAKPMPEGYHTVTPYLIVKGGSAAIAFYQEAFGAKEVMRLEMPGGRIGHAELQIGGSPITLHVYVENSDATVERAVAAGAKLIRPVADQFYGDRTGGVEDPFGHRWFVATHKEDLSFDEIRERAAAQARKS